MPGRPEHPFWHRKEQERMQPADILVSEITPSTVAKFLKGCQTIYSHVQKIRPDMIFIPQRGARPIQWVLEAFAQQHNTEYNFYGLPIGTNTDANTGQWKGLRPGEKTAVIQQEISPENGLLPAHINNALLIDEVSTGATLTQAALRLFPALQDRFHCDHLHVIAACDTSRKAKDNQDRDEQGVEKVTGFKELVGQAQRGIPTETVLLPLFYMDRPAFLDTLLIPPRATRLARSTDPVYMQMVMQNTEARDLFQNLTIALSQPRLLEAALLQANNPEAEQNGNLDSKFYGWVKFFVAQAHEKSQSQARIAWLQDFLQYAAQYVH